MQIRSRKPNNQQLPSIASISNDSSSQYHSFREEATIPKVSLKSIPNRSQYQPETEKMQIWPKIQEPKVGNQQKSNKQKSYQQNTNQQVNRTIYDLVSHIGVVDNSSQELSNEIKQANKPRIKIFGTSNTSKSKDKQSISIKDRKDIDQIKLTQNQTNFKLNQVKKSQPFDRQPPTDFFQKILMTNEANPQPKYSFLPDDPQEFKIEEEPEVRRQSSDQAPITKKQNNKETIFKSGLDPKEPVNQSKQSNNQFFTPYQQKANERLTDYQSNAYSTPSFSPSQQIIDIPQKNHQSANQRSGKNQVPSIQEQDRATMQSIIRIYPQVLSRIERNEQQIVYLSRKLDQIVKKQEHRQKLLYGMIRQKQTQIMDKQKQIVVYRQGINQLQEKERAKRDEQARIQLQMERARRLEKLIQENHRLCSEIMNKKTVDEQNNRKLKEKIYQSKLNDLHASSSFQPSTNLTTTHYPRYLPSQSMSHTRSYETRPRHHKHFI